MNINWRFFRFCMVGVINTSIDATVFVGLRLLIMPLLLANLISTSMGIIASYALNTRYTFKVHSLSKKRAIAYFAITLFGLWVVQPIVIQFLMDVDDKYSFTSYIVHFTGHTVAISNLFPKLSAIGVSTIWNYFLYSRIVFK